MLALLSLVAIFVLAAESALFSSPEDLITVAREHARFVFDLSRLVKNLESDLEYFKQKLRFYSQQQVFMDLEPEKFASNPLSAFTLIRTLTSDTLLIQHKLQSTLNEYSMKIANYTPKHGDLIAAIAGFSHLQETYNLKSADLAEGFIEEKKYSEGLTAHDLFEIGRHLIKSKRFSRSIEYLKLALKKTVIEHESEVHPSEILLNIVEASERRGDIKTAVQTLDEVIFLEPDNKKYVEVKKLLVDKFAPGQPNPEEEYTENFNIALTKTVCSGKLSKSPKDLMKLRCRLVSNKGFSKLAPFKLEEAHLHPYIVIFHDVIYEKEIEKLKELSRPILNQSVVFNKAGQLDISPEIRISKVAWFKDDKEEVVEKLTKRTEDMTGLSLKLAEPLQIQQYGIGGFYQSHFDAFDADDQQASYGWNRIATGLFYLSDVEKGGATVFPYLKLKIPAEKGSAAFWYNLLPSGERDHRTRHSGCPVLVGSKWIANKWIHVRGQTKQCNLIHEKNDEMVWFNKFLRLYEKGEIAT